jgi:hypothetical protein
MSIFIDKIDGVDRCNRNTIYIEMSAFTSAMHTFDGDSGAKWHITTIRFVLDLLCKWANLPELMSNRCRIIAIDGNIGAGKTTLMDRLEEQYRDCDDPTTIRH